MLWNFLILKVYGIYLAIVSKYLILNATNRHKLFINFKISCDTSCGDQQWYIILSRIQTAVQREGNGWKDGK